MALPPGISPGALFCIPNEVRDLQFAQVRYARWDSGGGARYCSIRITRMTTNPLSRDRIVERDLSYQIIGTFFEVHNALGFGFLEAIYARALEIALRERGLLVEREYPIAVYFKGQQIGFHRVDFLVERRVILELKSTHRLPEGAKRQLLSYLNSMPLELGLLLHFGPKASFTRVLRAVSP